MEFRKMERSSHTPPGWRLAAVKEAQDNRSSIDGSGLIDEWDRVRLLDGWMTGPGYRFYQRMQVGYRACLGYMLLVNSPTLNMSDSDEGNGSLYSEVPELSEEGRCAAFLLSCEDWNHEVLHWLLPAVVHHPSLRKHDESVKAASEVVSAIARKWQDVHAKSTEEECSSEMLEQFFEDLKVYVQGKCSESALMINNPNLEQRKISDEILKELDLTSYVTMFQDFGPEVVESVWDVVVENMAWRSLHLLCSALFDNMVIHSHPSLADLIHDAYFFLGETTKEGTTPVKVVNADFKRFDEILGFPMWSCKGKPDILGNVLVRAAHKGNANLVRKLIEHGVHVTATDDSLAGSTALHLAAFHDNVVIAEMVLREDETLVNVADSYKRTPLHIAARWARTRICAFLLHHNANLMAKDHTGYTPLHHALERRNDEVVLLLLSKGEVKGSSRLVDVKDDEGNTPLDIAISDGHYDVKMVAWFLSQSGQPESYFAKLQEIRRLPLSAYLRESSREGYVDVVQKLVDAGADPFDGDDEGKSSLHCAAECENESIAFKIIEKLLFDKKQGSINWGKASAADKYGRNVLHLAAFLGRTGLCENLIEVNENLRDSKDRDGQTPLFYVAAGAHDNRNLIGLFFDRHRQINSLSLFSLRDFSQMTPLHVAAGKGNINIVRELLDYTDEEYVVAADVLGQTALHKAASGGHVEIVEMLLEGGAKPLKERDCDGKTALHFAAEADGEKAVEIAKLLLDKCGTDKHKTLLLFASAIGKVSGNDKLEEFVDEEKRKIEDEETRNIGEDNVVMRVAATLGDIDMAVECVNRGANISLIINEQWIATLQKEEKSNVHEVHKKLKTIIDQASDKPALQDNLGRSPFAIGLAALFLNPFTKSPLTVGISGEWGMGKSSVMLQTETNLLKAVAQLMFKSSFQKKSSLGASKSKLSMKGKTKLNKIVNAIDVEKGDGPHMMEKIRMSIKRVKNFITKVSKIILSKNKKQEMELKSLKGPSEVKEPHIFIRLHSQFYKFWGITRALWQESTDFGDKNLRKFNNFIEDYKPEFHQIFKSLAIMDRSNVFEEEEESGSRNQLDREMSWEEYSLKGSIPSILTVQYNAWHYRNETEAWAGLAVQITKELEATMTVAHKLRTSWVYNWKNHKNKICFETILPFFLALMVAIWFTTIVWLIFNEGKLEDVKKLKYGGLPASLIVATWGLWKSVLSFVKPISSQVVDYICLPNHSQKLGYHQKVIDDINFLKESLYYKRSLMWEMFAFLWCCITWSWNENYIPETKIRKMPPTYGNKLRMIVFVDDLDRCEENVILQILSAINLVLATCEINVIMSMEKSMIKRAILRKYGNKNRKDNEELAENYLRKIIQLPLHLPDPSDSESTSFLNSQLGMWESSNSQPARRHAKVNPKFDMVTKTSYPERKKYYEDCIAEVKRELADSEILTGQQRFGEIEEKKKTEKAEGSEVEETAASEGEQAQAKEFDGEAEVAMIEIPGESVPTAIEDDEQQGEGSKCKQGLIDYLCALLCFHHVQSHEEAAKITDRDQSAGDQEEVEAGKRKRSLMDDLSSIMSAMLIPKYTPKERSAFRFLHKKCTRSRKVPREWKCFLAYHRLAWNIVYLTILQEDVIQVEGWQVQLVAWIFVCWEWRELITILIRKWNKLKVLRNWKSEVGPSLREIVEYYIEEELTNEKGSTAKGEDDGNEEVKKPASGNLSGDVMTTISETQVASTVSNLPEENMKGDDYLKEVLGRVLREQEEMREILRKTLKQQEEMREVLRKSLKQQEEMRDMLKRVLKEEDDKGESSNESRGRMVRKYLIEEEEMEGESSGGGYRSAGEEREEWNELRDSLQRYNVSMDGIQAFQKFRFFCEPGHLPWPLPQQDNFY